MKRVVAVLAALIVGPVFAPAQEWTRFRGPNGSGVSTTTVLPTEWTESDYLWTTRLPGRGHSSPVLWGERIFVTSGDAAGTRFVVCVDAARGKIVWQKAFPAGIYKMHKRNSVATSTPAVDAKRVYLLWATPDQVMTAALDHGGNPIWETPLGKFKGNHGIGVSPIVFEDMLIVPNDQDDAGSLIALDAATGAKRWDIPRKSGNATYATPCVYRGAADKPLLIFTNWKHGVTAVDPGAGKVVWEAPVFEPDKNERSIASPVLAGDLILGTCGFVTAQKHLVALRPSADGQPQEVWRVEKPVAYLPTPVVKLPWVFAVTEKGLGVCLEAKTGKLLWQERLDNTFSASPVLAGEHLYCVADDGEVVVLHAGPKFQIVSRQALGEASQSTPAIAGGRIIFRTPTKLLALAGKRVAGADK